MATPVGGTCLILSPRFDLALFVVLMAFRGCFLPPKAHDPDSTKIAPRNATTGWQVLKRAHLLLYDRTDSASPTSWVLLRFAPFLPQLCPALAAGSALTAAPLVQPGVRGAAARLCRQGGRLRSRRRTCSVRHASPGAPRRAHGRGAARARGLAGRSAGCRGGRERGRRRLPPAAVRPSRRQGTPSPARAPALRFRRVRAAPHRHRRGARG